MLNRQLLTCLSTSTVAHAALLGCVWAASLPQSLDLHGSQQVIVIRATRRQRPTPVHTVSRIKSAEPNTVRPLQPSREKPVPRFQSALPTQSQVAVQPSESVRSSRPVTRAAKPEPDAPETAAKHAPIRRATPQPVQLASHVSPAVVTTHAARPIHNPRPDYPASAYRRGVQGQVVLEIDIDERGQVRQVRVKKSSGSALLDNSAVSAIRRWRFHPATRGGRAVAWQAQLPINFRL